MKQIAQGLAALGRGEDKMLVHMTPKEVAGLQQLALAHGGSLTVHPQTGLPEAGFLSNILPTLVGVGLSFVPGMEPWAAGLIAGGLETARTGNLGKGVMAGLGAYGGAGLSGALQNMGTQAAQQTALAAAQPAIQAEAASLGMMPSEIAAETAAGFRPMAQQAALSGAQNAPLLGSQGLGDAAAGLKQFGQPGSFSQFGTELGKQFPSGMAKTAAGIGALGTIGAFDQPKLAGLPVAGPSERRRYGYTPGQVNPRFGQPGEPYFLGQGYTDQGTYYAARGGAVPASSKTLGGQMFDYTPPGDATASQMGRMSETYLQYLSENAKDAAVQAAAVKELQRRAPSASPAISSFTKMAEGGDVYAAGGKLLRGAGDGMSDSIPAVINGPGRAQRAALADGEFVVPADVVSHLGNGSTEAGAKRLYSMMDKVRQARTGTKKQGKQIKADKYMPA